MSSFSDALSSTDTQALIDLRRDLHAHPELGYDEHRTAGRVVQWLRDAGFSQIYPEIAGTGVVAVLDSGLPGPTVGYRADMDALPIEEQTNAPYRSCHVGRMHACGHDVHTAVALGVAKRLAQTGLKAGRAVFVFQPNEEGAPGAGPSGADAMVDAGVLTRFQPHAMLALHCMPTLPVGKIGFCPRGVWAGSDRLLIQVQGQQTHAAYPHLGVDPVVVASHLILALQAVSSRMIDTQSACVLSITKVNAGHQFNVLSDTANLEGILRTLDEATRAEALAAVKRIVAHLPQSFGASAALSVHRGADPVVNDPKWLAYTLAALPADALTEIAPQMGAEDFSAFSRRVPSVYLMLGVRNEARAITAPLHSPLFDVDEACLPLAVDAMTRALLSLTSDPPPAA